MVLLRSTLFNAYLVGLTIVMGLIAIPLRLFAPRFALSYAQLWCRLLVSGLARICGIRLHVVGLDTIPRDAPCLIASQHQSAFDTLVWMTLLPRPAYVMKQELIRIPLVGPMLMLSGMLPVERGAGGKAIRSLLKETDRAVADGRQVIIFPEGTRVAPGANVPLKQGITAMARHSRMKIYPVATDSGRCWGRNGFLKYPGTISIVVGAPLDGHDRETTLSAIAEAWRTGEQSFASRNAAIRTT